MDPKERNSRKVSQSDLLTVADWVMANKLTIDNLPIEAIRAMIQEKTGVRVPGDATVRAICQAYDVTIRPSRRTRKVLAADQWKVLAKAVAGLYKELGQPIHDDLWSLVGTDEEEDN